MSENNMKRTAVCVVKVLFLVMTAVGNPTPAEADPPSRQTAPVGTDPKMTSDDADYGYSEKKPVKVGSKEKLGGPEAEQAYLDDLRDANGKPIHYKRLGSVGRSPDGNIMDLYVVTSSTGQKVKLYIDMYHPQNEPAKQLAPKGFYKATGSASAARADGKDSKNYLNLSLPRGSRFTPIVLTASERKAIVARVAEVDGKREIQVLEGHGDKWDFVGKQGRAVTGVDGNFLIDAKQGPDGRLWVLAGYTPPSNPDRGFSNYLYCFENDRWKLAGPQKGQPSDFFGTDFGVHFLGGAEPVRHFVAGKEIPDPRQNHNLMRLDENRFVPLPAQDLVRKHHGTMVWRKNDAWYFVPRNADGQTQLDAYWVKGARANDVVGPIRLGDWKARLTFRQFAISDQGMIAVLGWEGKLDNLDTARTFGQLFRPNGDQRYERSELPPLPAKYTEHLAWSPTGSLFVTTLREGRTIEVFSLAGAKWERKNKAEQPMEIGLIWDPRLFFRTNGEPVVVWEDFVPRR